MSKKTSINLIIDEDESSKFTALVNVGNEFHSDGMPLELYCKILGVVCDIIDEWNQQHKIRNYEHQETTVRGSQKDFRY